MIKYVLLIFCMEIVFFGIIQDIIGIIKWKIEYDREWKKVCKELGIEEEIK